MRVLIVEDETALRERLLRAFRQRGWAGDAAADGIEAGFLGEEVDFDLAIVDLGLPGISGLELIRRWRTRGRRFPVLVLTARADWQDKVEGLEAGADDYVTKPFHLEEVFARANALLRRAGGRSNTRVRYGPLVLDVSARQVICNGELLELTSYEYNTLEYLIQRAGQIVSKTELTEHLYDQDFERDSNVIEVFVARLRRKIDPAGSLKPIRTVRGAGYRFELAEGEGQ